MSTERKIEVELDGPSGPRVRVTGDWDESEIEAELPTGWTVGSNWHNGVQLRSGSWSYPLVQDDGDTVTTGQIRRLQREAAEAGDLAQAHICRVACGDEETATQGQIQAARVECARVIADAVAARG